MIGALAGEGGEAGRDSVAKGGVEGVGGHVCVLDRGPGQPSPGRRAASMLVRTRGDAVAGVKLDLYRPAPGH